MPHINIKKGHDLHISGKPDKNITDLNNFETVVAILPTDFNGVRPKLMISEGDEVKIGFYLFVYVLYSCLSFYCD